MFNKATHWGLVPEGSNNPCRYAVMYKEPPRERFLTEEEFRRLGWVLSEVEADGGVSAHAAAARLHDLRHSFASRALALGESLPMIGKLLGHARIETTARYAHLARDSVDAAAARVAASIGADILGNVNKNKTGTV